MQKEKLKTGETDKARLVDGEKEARKGEDCGSFWRRERIKCGKGGYKGEK